MKRLCQLSIFVALLAGIAALILIDMPGQCWWNPAEFHGVADRVPLWVWLAFNVVAPVFVEVLSTFTLVFILLWLRKVAEALCSWARRMGRE